MRPSMLALEFVGAAAQYLFWDVCGSIGDAALAVRQTQSRHHPARRTFELVLYLSGVSRESLVTTSCVSNINRSLERITCHTLVLHSLSSSFFCSTRRCLLSFP